MNNNMYEINYEGHNFSLDKSDAKFKDGYAVVEFEIVRSQSWMYGYDNGLSLKGVIDENFNIVFDFQQYIKKIDLFPKGNILTSQMINVGEDKDTYLIWSYQHYKINDGKTEFIAEFHNNDCEFINETTLKVKSRNSEGSFQSLYDIVKGDFISNKFTTIDYFNIINFETEERIAKAILKIKAENKPYKTRDILCYIYDKGEIRTPLYNSYNGTYIETKTSDFNFDNTVDSIKNDIDSESIGQAVNNYLLKELRRK